MLLSDSCAHSAAKPRSTLQPAVFALKLPRFKFRFSWPQGLPRSLSSADLAALKTRSGALLVQLRTRWADWRAQVAQKPGLTIRPERVSAWVCFVLMLLIAGCATYWLMRIVQVVYPPQVSAKGVVFYEAASNLRVATLFGEKDFDPSRLVLRGVVITDTVNDINQGVALIEADGKPAETLAVGEMMSPGIRLEKISPDGVVVRYRGRTYELQEPAAGYTGR